MKPATGAKNTSPDQRPGLDLAPRQLFSSASSSLRTQAGPPNTVKPGICFLMAVRPAKQWICSSSRCYSGDDSFFFFNMSLSLCDNSERQHRFVSVGASHQPVSQTVGEETGDGRGPDTPRIIFFSFILSTYLILKCHVVRDCFKIQTSHPKSTFEVWFQGKRKHCMNVRLILLVCFSLFHHTCWLN